MCGFGATQEERAEMPRQHEEVIRVGTQHVAFRPNGNARAGREAAKLVAVDLADAWHILLRHAAVLQQDVAFRRRTEPQNDLALRARPAEEASQLISGFIHP